MNLLKTAYWRWRLALAVARLRRAGASGEADAITKAATELRALAGLIAERLPNHQVRWGAAKTITSCDRILADVKAAVGA
jgi:hypothetical protein